MGDSAERTTFQVVSGILGDLGTGNGRADVTKGELATVASKVLVSSDPALVPRAGRGCGGSADEKLGG